MTEKYDELFKEGSIGDLNIRNRIVMPPMVSLLSGVEGQVTDRLIDYYSERAKGGAGLIVVEATGIDYPESRGFATELMLHDDKYVPGFSKLAKSVHNHGAKIFVQLHHAGRQTSPKETNGEQPVSASEEKGRFLQITPRKLETEEVEDLVDKHVEAAVRAKESNFDGVQLHGGHGYLIQQFISSKTNKRDDKYGGDLDDRLTFAKEIIQGIREELGEEFPIDFRFSADEFVDDGYDLEEAKEIAKKLEEIGVDSIHVTAGVYESMPVMIEPMRFEEGWRDYLAEGIKDAVDVPVTTVAVIRDPEKANKMIKDGKTDFVALGRGHIADPYWARKAAQGREDEINKCISCNIGCIGQMFKNKSISCTVNPEVGREEEFNNLKRAENPRNVLIVGGGPAGMETAKYAAERGHNVTLYEKDKELGGQMKLASTPPGKDKIKWFMEQIKREIKELGVEIKTGKEADLDTIKSENPDDVVIATGAQPIKPEIKNNENVLQAWDVLEQEMNIKNEEVLVIGGGQVGCDLSEYLLEKNNQVTILEMLDDIALDMETVTRVDLIQRFTEEENIDWNTNEKVQEIDGAKVITEKDGEQKTYTADKVILAMGSKPDNELAQKISKQDYNVYKIGDAKEPNRIFEATQNGAEAGISIGNPHKTFSPLYI